MKATIEKKLAESTQFSIAKRTEHGILTATTFTTHFTAILAGVLFKGLASFGAFFTNFRHVYTP